MLYRNWCLRAARGRDDSQRGSLRLLSAIFAALGLALAKEAGKAACVATSSGNTGAALAAFSAAFGMRAYILINERTPIGKLVQMQSHGARIFRVKGMGVDAAESAMVVEELRRITVHEGLPLLISAYIEQSPKLAERIAMTKYAGLGLCELTSGRHRAGLGRISRPRGVPLPACAGT